GGGSVVGFTYGPITGKLVFFRQSKVVGLVDERDGIGAKHDSEDTIELTSDLGDERGHVSGAERDAGGAHHIAAVLLDLVNVGVARRLSPRVVEIDEVPFSAHL